MLARISAKWSRIVSQSASSAITDRSHSEAGTAANNEVVEERLIRELTREHLQLLLNMTEKPAPTQGKAEASFCWATQFVCSVGYLTELRVFLVCDKQGTSSDEVLSAMCVTSSMS